MGALVEVEVRRPDASFFGSHSDSRSLQAIYRRETRWDAEHGLCIVAGEGKR